MTVFVGRSIDLSKCRAKTYLVDTFRRITRTGQENGAVAKNRSASRFTTLRLPWCRNNKMLRFHVLFIAVTISKQLSASTVLLAVARDDFELYARNDATCSAEPLAGCFELTAASPLLRSQKNRSIPHSVRIHSWQAK